MAARWRGTEATRVTDHASSMRASWHPWRLIQVIPYLVCVRPERIVAEGDHPDVVDLRIVQNELPKDRNHQPRRALEWEAIDTGADRAERDGRQVVGVGEPERGPVAAHQ